MNRILKLLLGLTLVAIFAACTKKQGGDASSNSDSVIFNLGGEPTTLHPITSTDVYSSEVHNYVLDSLLARNLNTYAWEPRIAEKWEIAKDKKTFTFWLRKDIVFHDGQPLTAEDVKFSFDAIFEDKYQAAHLRPYYEGIAKIEIVDPYTIKAIAKDAYFKNFDSVAGLTVIPKHIYSDVEKSSKMNKTIIGAGPYMLESYDRGQKIILKKFDKWFGGNYEHLKGFYSFNRVSFRFVKDENVEIEMIKKGELDYIGLTAEQFSKKTEGEPWGTRVLKFKVENSSPKGYGYYGWNQRKDLFKDKGVRWALAHLLNRDEMNKKFRFGYSMPATGPWYQQSEYASPNVKAIEFSPVKAQELLKKAGWKDEDKNGILEKTINGQKTEFKFALVYANKDSEKYHTLYKEDLKKAGIEMELKLLEWNSLLKLIDDGTFDAVSMGWSGGDIDIDPKQIWHSSSSVVGGSNFIAYKNPTVDKMIDQARLENDKAKRVEKLRKVFEVIADDAPYAFMFNDQFTFYAHASRVKKTADTLKFSIGVQTWTLQPN